MKDRLKSIWSANRPLIRFLAAAFSLLLAWVLATAYFPNAIHEMHYAIIKPQADICASLLRLTGYEIDQDYMVNGCEARLVFAGYGPICFGTGCSGLELFILFFGFIMLMRGRLLDKLWFIPAGFLLILVLNILRVYALSIIFYRWPQYLNFNHKYTFVIIVYGAIFGLWVLWIKRYADKTNTKNS